MQRCIRPFLKSAFPTCERLGHFGICSLGSQHVNAFVLCMFVYCVLCLRLHNHSFDLRLSCTSPLILISTYSIMPHRCRRICDSNTPMWQE